MVNGQPVSQIALGPGDLIQIGDTEVEFQVRE
jgi:pSer/pThr/pTyr-binding forkhead associated (FHA) protein